MKKAIRIQKLIDLSNVLEAIKICIQTKAKGIVEPIMKNSYKKMFNWHINKINKLHSLVELIY